MCQASALRPDGSTDLDAVDIYRHEAHLDAVGSEGTGDLSNAGASHLQLQGAQIAQLTAIE